MPRILLIDDDAAVRTALSKLHEHDGHSVTPAANGREGLSHLDKESVDLVITDLVMPEIDGLEFLMKIRRRDPAPPVIVISDGGRRLLTPYLDMARQFGAAAVLPKPVHLDELRKLIADLVTG